MVDLKKIDTFFEDTRTFKNVRADTPGRPLRYKENRMRLIKLIIPSAAAVLIALLIIFSTSKKTTLLPEYDLTVPKVGELEKLRVENTTFSITDLDGKISSFTADLMEETEPQSKIIKLTNPKGQLAIDNQGKKTDITADIGYYNQQDEIVTASGHIVAVYDNDTTVKTNAALYNFKEAFGQGDDKVFIAGDWGKIWADGFVYDKKTETLTLKGHTEMLREDNTLTASQKTTYFKLLNQVIAEGDVVLTRPDLTLYTDKAVIFLTDAKSPEIVKVEAFGNVRLTTPQAEGAGEYGLYLPDQNLFELSHHVVLTKDGNLIYGDKAVFNTQTSVGRLLSASKQNRITGVIRGINLKGKKHGTQ
ncbi:MAG: LPS export ABC transporter periplasmic protein LptC [Alphaproteobacteria bacterium]|nr:LPS export ABC transporter periplasmic protein LptC [Alphaproteobacteria bacterium]